MARNFSDRLRQLDNKPGSTSAGPPGSADVDDKPIDGLVFAMSAMMGLLGLIVFAVLFGVQSIEANLEGTIGHTLRENGIRGIDVLASGRDIIVVGKVPEEAHLESVPAFVGSVPGVRSAEINLDLIVVEDLAEIKVTGDPLVVSWDGASAQASGSLSSEGVVGAVARALETEFPGIDTGGLSAREGLPDERDWISSVLGLYARVHGLNDVGLIVVDPGDRLIKVTAEFETSSQRSKARQQVHDIVNATTFELTTAMTYRDEVAVEQEVVDELQQNIDVLIEGKVVEFETNSEIITLRGQELLTEVLDALRQVPNVTIEIAGHTDDIGSEEYNAKLSRRRADAVLTYLVANGEPPERFVVVGHGESMPLLDNATEDGRSRNRRIEFSARLEG